MLSRPDERAFGEVDDPRKPVAARLGDPCDNYHVTMPKALKALEYLYNT